MRKVLIIAPHYPPSNLVSVHRSRLFAQNMPAFGWEPMILCVHEKYYEEVLDHNLEKLLPQGQNIQKVKAYGLTRPRIIGDIGLRGFLQLRKKALEIIRQEKIDFVYIPIPSFYVSLIGPYLHRKTNVKFGIDYIDPWVHRFPGSDRIFSRHWFSTQLAKILEPIAVKNASVITGVSERYYQGVIERNKHLLRSCIFGAMPYGGEKSDFDAVRRLGLKPLLFQTNEKLKLVYAGAMLPKAFEPLELIFQAIVSEPSLFENLEIYFIGTGKSSNDSGAFNIKPIAKKFGLWEKQIFEHPSRLPYLDVLTHLIGADGVFILGSTEPHYTPSKVFQAVLSEKPILAVLHQASSAVSVLNETNAGIVLTFETAEVDKIKFDFPDYYKMFLEFLRGFDPAQVNRTQFEKYSARNVTGQLAELLDKVVK